MNVSFCGFNNVYIGKYSQPESILGSYVDNDGDVKVGKKYTDWIKVRATLTDDLASNDLTQFKKMLEKSNNYYKNTCVNRGAPDVVELTMQQTIVDKDGEKAIVNSHFMLNGVHLTLNKRNKLPFYTFMANMTKSIMNDGYRSENQKELLKRFNTSVQNKAMDYIDNIMPTFEED